CRRAAGDSRPACFLIGCTSASLRVHAGAAVNVRFSSPAVRAGCDCIEPERTRVVARGSPSDGLRETGRAPMLAMMRRNSRSKGPRRLWIVLTLLAAAGVAAAQPVPAAASGGPTGPPPTGQGWVQSGGDWVMVPAPPWDGPYEWMGGRWVAAQAPPPAGTEWIPGHWSRAGWVPGYWAPVAPGGPGLTWVAGHWGPQGRVWIPGHWAGQI